MSDFVYLKNLNINGFRTYRKETAFDFPPEPSLTVIVGPNGLGKSTMFDSVEWALTGELKRLAGITNSARDRKDSIGKSPNVSLNFGDGTKIARTAKQWLFNDSSEAGQLEDWLVNTRWRGMKSLADCLHLTHFLGQSTRQLFVHQDGKERWSRLEGPAGLQTLWNIEQKLGRNSTTLAFGKMESEGVLAVSAATEKISRLEEIVTELRQSKDLARAGSAMDEDEIRQNCAAIEGSLIDSVIAVPPPPPPDIDSLLARQQRLLEQAKSTMAQKFAAVYEWRGKVVDFGIQVTALQELQFRLNQHKENESLVDAAVVDTAARLTASVSRSELLEREILSLEKKLEETNAASNLLQESATLTAAILENEIALARLDQQRIEIQHQLDELSLAASAAKVLQEKFAAANQRQFALQELFIQAQAYAAAKSNWQRQVQLLEISNSDEDSLRRERVELIEKIEQNTERTIGAEAQLQAAKQAADLLTVAVTQIASLLEESDCKCPVCSTVLEEGILRTRALFNASEINKNLIDQQLVCDKLKYERQTFENRVAVLDAELDVQRKRQESLMETSQVVVTMETQLRQNPLIGNIAAEEIDAVLAQEKTRIDEQLAEAALNFMATRLDSDIAIEISTLEGQKAALFASTQGALSKRDALDSSVNIAKNRLLLLGSPTSEDLGNLRETYLIELARSRQQLDVSTSEREAARILSAAATSEKILSDREVASAQTAVASVQVALDRARREWAAQEASGEPSAEAVENLIVGLTYRQKQLEQLVTVHETLLKGRQSYLSHQRISKLEHELNEIASKQGVADSAQLLAELTAKKQVAEMGLRTLRLVRTKRDTVLSRMQERNAAIRSEISEPLNASVSKFCAALMSDRDFNVKIDAIASAASAQALLSMRTDGNLESSRGNPLLYMSEGQLAAVSLCLLFGASTIYPWSRWRALLLDDPLQHNDTIHAAAFIDTVRNLIQEEHYQIIVSTHDMEQAGYFLRKCANAGITTRYWHLYARDESGGILMNTG